MEKYDLIIVGAGPAGIFTAVELLRHGSKKKMLLVEKGKPVEKRHCPKAEVGHCVNCRPTCAITTGFSGAGAFSDGKLSLSYEVGGDLPTLIGEEFAQELIDYTDKIYLEFGADPHVEGIYTGEDIKEIRKNAIHAGLKLVDCPIRHLGTEKAQELYLAIQNYLADNGVEMRFNTECENIILEEEGCKGVLLKDGDSLLPVYADEVVIGTGRRGADWLEKLCAEHHIAHKPGTVDIGVRVECRNEVMEKVNKVLYESKLIGYPKPWKNKVRTFCQNPGGFVAQENYDNDLAVVNGGVLRERFVPFLREGQGAVHGCIPPVLVLCDGRAHGAGGLECGGAGDGARLRHAAGEHRSCKAALFVARDPALKPVDGALVRVRLVLGRRGEQVNVAKRIVRREERVCAVEQSLELTAHFVVVNGRCEGNHVRVLHFFRDGDGVVVDHAPAQRLAGEAAAAERDVLAAQRDDLHRVPGGARPVGKGVCQRLGVAARAQARAENENVFGHIGLLLFERLDAAAAI